MQSIKIQYETGKQLKLSICTADFNFISYFTYSKEALVAYTLIEIVDLIFSPISTISYQGSHYYVHYY